MDVALSTSPALPQLAVLPRAPRNGSPVPWLTSLYHKSQRGDYGNSSYPGNCGGMLIKDLLLYFRPRTVFDPMTGSGTCRDVCDELDILCASKDIRFGFDACDSSHYDPNWCFDFIWLHPPYWRQKVYSRDRRDLSTAPTLSYFLYRYEALIRNCASMLVPGGKLAILMGDYLDRQTRFCPLVFHTQRLCFRAGLRQPCTQIVRFQHGNTSSSKTYKSSFIPGLHDICTIVEKPLLSPTLA